MVAEARRCAFLANDSKGQLADWFVLGVFNGHLQDIKEFS